MQAVLIGGPQHLWVAQLPDNQSFLDIALWDEQYSAAPVSEYGPRIRKGVYKRLSPVLDLPRDQWKPTSPMVIFVWDGAW